MDVPQDTRRPAPRVAGLVLAAGAGRRYGGPKALVRVDGQLLVERAAATAFAGGCAPVVVVLGAGGTDVRAAADRATVDRDLRRSLLLDNPDWATGMGSSLRAGLAALGGSGVDAALVLLVDMPGITAEAVRRLVATAAPDVLVMAGYGDRRGHPVLLGRAHWAGVAALAVDDVGARPYLHAHPAAVRVVPCDDIADPGDLDTREDVEAWRTTGPPAGATGA